MNEIVTTVASRVLALIRERPGVIEPQTLDMALGDYAWALTEAETGIDRNAAHVATTYRGMPVERVQAARRAKAIALAHANRLSAAERNEILAELERVTETAEAA